ncbi:MAG TPA: helix-turn-helix domain-containing protein [Amycolatopsis sp.]|nr:helix-turn-helix domain-containing protein [Amycolatopsis sp.]
MLTKKGLATRQRIVDAMAAEIRDRGVGNVTLDDVCLRSCTGKGQLFHYFPKGKEELLLAVAQREADRLLADQQPHLGQLTRQWRDTVVRRYRRQGADCALGALLTEIGQRTPAAQAVTMRLFEQWQAQVQAGIEAMQASGDISGAIDPVRAASAMIAAIQGGVILLMTTGSARHLEAALDLCLDYLLTATPAAA